MDSNQFDISDLNRVVADGKDPFESDNGINLSQIRLATKGRPPGRPKGKPNSPLMYSIADTIAGVFAERLDIEKEVLLLPPLFHARFPTWPIAAAEVVVDPGFMAEVAARLPIHQDVTRLCGYASIGGAVISDGCIHGSVTHNRNRKSPTIGFKIEITQSDREDLDNEWQLHGYPLESSVQKNGSKHNHKQTKTPWRLEFNGAWGVALAALCYPWLGSKSRQALMMMKLYCEGLYFAHPRNAGWRDDVWEHRLRLVQNLSGLKRRLNRRPGHIRAGRFSTNVYAHQRQPASRES